MGRLAEMERMAEVRLQAQEQIRAVETRANSAAVQALNDQAEFEIWGSKGAPIIGENSIVTNEPVFEDVDGKGNSGDFVSAGRSEFTTQGSLGTITWLNPETGEKLLQSAGKLADIAANPKYGRTQAERDAAASKYSSHVLSLVDQGYELCQAKLVMDLRETSRDSYCKHIASLMKDGMSPTDAEAKAKVIYDKVDNRRLELIKTGGAFSKEEYDNLLAAKSGNLSIAVATAANRGNDQPQAAQRRADAAEPQANKGGNKPTEVQRETTASQPQEVTKPEPEPEQRPQTAEAAPVQAKSAGPNPDIIPAGGFAAAEIGEPEAALIYDMTAAGRKNKVIILDEEGGKRSYVIEGGDIRVHERSEDGHVEQRVIGNVDEDEDLPRVVLGEAWTVEDEVNPTMSWTTKPIAKVDVVPGERSADEEAPAPDSVPSADTEKVEVKAEKPRKSHRLRGLGRKAVGAAVAPGVRVSKKAKESGEGRRHHRKLIASISAGILAVGLGLGLGLSETGNSNAPKRPAGITQSHKPKAPASKTTTSVTQPNTQPKPTVVYGPGDHSASINFGS